MPTLSNTDLSLFCASPVNEDTGMLAREGDLALPAGYNQPDQDQILTDAACWNWVFNAGRGVRAAAENPENLYDENAPINAFTMAPRAALSAGRLGGAAAGLNAAWLAARNEAALGGATVARVAFMGAMAGVAATRNGFTVSAGATPYSIYVTAPEDDWYHWQHWALALTYGGQTRFMQTEPNIPVSAGFRRIWEANRHGHITASVYVTGFLQEQIDLIKVWIHHKWCHTCDQRKPYRTTFGTRWHRCQAAHQRVYCGVHGAALAANGRFSRTRLCACGTGTVLIDDV